MTRRRTCRTFAAAAAVAALLSASGCGTATIEDAVPVSATAQPAAASPPNLVTSAPGQPAPATASAAAAVDATPPQPAAPFARPGDYPNLNVVPVPAATQITEDEKDADFTLLRAIRAQQEAESRAASVDVKSSAEELRRLAKRHAADALNGIKGE